MATPSYSLGYSRGIYAGIPWGSCQFFSHSQRPVSQSIGRKRPWSEDALPFHFIGNGYFGISTHLFQGKRGEFLSNSEVDTVREEMRGSHLKRGVSSHLIEETINISGQFQSNY